MEYSRRSNKIYFTSILLAISFLIFDQNSKAQSPPGNNQLAPACFRLEGTRMPCTGGGGGQSCPEDCQSKYGDKIGQTCSNQSVGTICDNVKPTQCYGTKCCDTCANHTSDHCGTMYVCGQACPGTQQVDCSKQSCMIPVLGKGVAKYDQVQDGCTPGIACSDPIQSGDGCVCTCQKIGNTCVGNGNSRCITCSCGTTNTCQPNYKTVCTDQSNLDCVSGYTSVPMVNDGPCSCKCPYPSNPPSQGCSKCQ